MYLYYYVNGREKKTLQKENQLLKVEGMMVRKPSSCDSGIDNQRMKTL